MIITNQGVAIQPCFQQAKHMQFCKNRPIDCVYKTETKYASKDRIELAVFKAELLLAVLVLGLRLAVLLRVLLGVLLLSHSVGYGRERHNDKQTQT